MVKEDQGVSHGTPLASPAGGPHGGISFVALYPGVTTPGAATAAGHTPSPHGPMSRDCSGRMVLQCPPYYPRHQQQPQQLGYHGYHHLEACPISMKRTMLLPLPLIITMRVRQSIHLMTFAIPPTMTLTTTPVLMPEQSIPTSPTHYT